MRTPAGKDCPHYHADFHRGRNLQECRLAKANPSSMHWRPEDCSKCPVPEILNANANPYMELTLTIKPRLLGFGRTIQIDAHCTRHDIEIEDPYVGCPMENQDRPGLDLFRKALEDDDD